MNSKAVALIATVILGGSAFDGKSLDLTPTPGFRDLEGVRIPVVYFSEGADKVTFQPPAKWGVSGGGNTVNFIRAEQPDSQMQLRVFPRKAPVAGEFEELEKWCRTLLPQDAVQVTLEGEGAGTFTLRAMPNREFTYTYSAQGRRFSSSISVVDLTAEERFAAIISARASDFKATREAAMRSLFSMSWSR